MLVSVQTSGSKPPLFFVHGVHGVMLLGSAFASVLGPNQPLYVINANGIDERQAVIDNVRDMVLSYADEIQAVCPAGPLRIGGMCSGCFAAIEIARSLQERRREIGAVILADPPPVPFSYEKAAGTADLRQPHVAQQLYGQVRRTLLDYAADGHTDMPFDARDPQQVHAATLAGVGSLVAFATYIPTPFSGPAELIISAERAAGFFHPQMPWHRLLPGARVVHVLPWNHTELFRSGREAVARLLKFILDQASPLDDAAQCGAERRLA